MNESPGNGATTEPTQPGLFELIPTGRKEIGEQLRRAVENVAGAARGGERISHFR